MGGFLADQTRRIRVGLWVFWHDIEAIASDAPGRCGCCAQFSVLASPLIYALAIDRLTPVARVRCNECDHWYILPVAILEKITVH